VVEVVEKVREGFEPMKNELDQMKANIEAEKELEREEFEKALEEKYFDRATRIDRILEQIVYTEEIEVPDPVEETELDEAVDTFVEQTI
jgi:hypothetical protein